MTFATSINMAINYELELSNYEKTKEEIFFKIIKIVCLKFLKAETNEQLKEYFNDFEFINDEYEESYCNKITPSIISELYYNLICKEKSKNGVFYTLNSYSYKFTKDILYKYLCRQCNVSENIGIDFEDSIFIKENKRLIEENIRCCKILDMGCGTGNLIFNMIVNIYELIKELDLNIDLEEIIKNCVAIDIDSMALNILKIRIFLYLSNIKGNFHMNEFEELFEKESKLRKFRGIYVADVLDELDIQNESFNIVISNPPYVKILKEKIKNYINIYSIESTNHYDLTYIFINKILNYIKSFGIVGLITSNVYLQDVAAESIRKRLYNKFTIISIKEEDNIFNKKVQAVTVSTILQNSSNRTFLGINKFLSNNRLFDLDNKYQINFINDEILMIKNKLDKFNYLYNYFDIKKNGKSDYIVNNGIYKYFVNDEKYKFNYSEIGLIILPTQCQINRFASIDKKFEKDLAKSTIIIKSKYNDLKLEYFIYFVCLLNSNLIYFWMIITGKFNSKNTLRVTVDIIKRIPIRFNKDNEIINNLVHEFYNYLNNDYNVIELQDKIDEIIYNIYNLDNNEIDLIIGFIKQYEEKANFPKRLKRYK